MSPRTSTRLVLTVAFTVLLSVVALLFWRLAATFGIAGDDVTTPSSRGELVGSAPPSGATPPVGAPDPSASVTGSIPPPASPADPAAGLEADPDGSTPAPDPTDPAPTQTTPGQTTPPQEQPPTGEPSDPTMFADPAAWPDDLPAVGEHRLLDYATETGEERWLLAVPGGTQLAGGRFVGGLTRLEWKVSSMSTANTVTAIGQFDAKRVSAVLRPGDSALPEGWSYLEVVYSPFIPQFSPPTTTPDTDASVRGRA